MALPLRGWVRPSGFPPKGGFFFEQSAKNIFLNPRIDLPKVGPPRFLSGGCVCGWVPLPVLMFFDNEMQESGLLELKGSGSSFSQPPSTFFSPRSFDGGDAGILLSQGARLANFGFRWNYAAGPPRGRYFTLTPLSCSSAEQVKPGQDKPRQSTRM